MRYVPRAASSWNLLCSFSVEEQYDLVDVVWIGKLKQWDWGKKERRFVHVGLLSWRVSVFFLSINFPF